ncbi:hypothetical protein C2845_PM11G19160 [Panicum miliaceum]|uniref:F-box protein AT5G49610-like beta-propeller domain-containing protein n=1 Tax=Panicum miliaceum TaxID=4540 RepID=A0A3L6RQE7_PANMI|nr:hypothetical protein C2845_PM11G19160 [Panicum miliaceum]
MSSKAMMLSPLLVEEDTAANKVLTNDDLLGEILPRIHCPSCLVCAALTCKRWLRNASNETTIHRFRSQMLSHLLGVYISIDGFSNPKFVPLPDASRPELAVALRHGNFSFNNMDSPLLSIWDCRNDRVLYGFSKSFNVALGPALRAPLRCPGEDTVILSPQPSTTWPNCPHAMLLPDDDSDDSSCYRVDISNKDRTVCAKVFVIRAGTWTIHLSTLADLAKSPQKILTMTLLMRGKIYMMTMAGYILTLDIATTRFSIVDLPRGVEFKYTGNLVPCRGDNSVLYLFNVKGDKLTVWFQRMDDNSSIGSRPGEWILRDTISLPETCGHLMKQGGGPLDGQGWEEAVVSVVGVGDNAEFVFLEFEETGVIGYMHLKSRKVKKVYQRHPDNDFSISVLPFMMVWPVVFPELGADEGEGMQQ